MISFEPEDTPADPAAIRTQAWAIERLANTICGHGEDVNRHLRAGANTFTELIAEHVRKRAGYQEQIWAVALEGVFWGAAVTRAWADNVQDFKNARGNLLKRWNAGLENGFGVGKNKSDYDSLANNAHEEMYLRKRGELVWELRGQFTTIWDELQRNAQARAGELQTGPTAESIGLLYNGGALSPAARVVFDAYLGAPSPEMRQSIDQMIADGTLPPEFRGMNVCDALAYLRRHPELAQRLEKLSPGERALGRWEADLAKAKTPEQIRQMFAQASPADRQWLAILFPGKVRTLDGAPFPERITANHVRVIAELDRELGKDCQDQNQGRIKYYNSILNDGRQILYFDPRKDGAIAELHGHIGPNTRNVGILVPGTTVDLGNFQDFSNRARSFVNANPDGSLAMIAWMGGDLPDGVMTDAPFNNYAHRLAPKLADFSHSVRAEINSTAAANNGVMITVAGHSYGGAVVGLAETHGLDANRVLHIASAGMGDDVDGPEDYHNANSKVDRYSMTAPGDLIEHAQGKAQTGSGSLSELAADFFPKPGNVGHGEDPDEFKGVTRLDTGNYREGNPIRGESSHGKVFESGSDSWQNMYEVFTGGEVSLYRKLEVEIESQGGPARYYYDKPARTKDIR